MIATGAIRTSLPSTMVPVRSLIIDARRPVGLHREAFQFGDEFGGASREIRRDRNADQTGIIGACALRANFWLMASAMRADVVKSGSRSCSRTTDFGATEGAARSTMAPLGARPTVG